MKTQETMLEEMRKATNYGFAAPLYAQADKFYKSVLKTAEAMGLLEDDESTHPITNALAHIACARFEFKQFMEENVNDMACCPKCKVTNVGKHTDGKYHCDHCGTEFLPEEGNDSA